MIRVPTDSTDGDLTMRAVPCAATMLLALSVARADLAPPPIAPAKGDNIAPGAISVLTAGAEAGREDLASIMDSVKAPATERRGRTVTAHAQLPPNPCESDMSAALRLCVRWLRNSMVRIEAATLDLMRASLFEVSGDLRRLERAMYDTIEEQKAFARGEPPPARPIPQNPCLGWNVSFWRDCVARVDARLAGNLPDEASAAEIIRARDRLKQMLESMIALKKMDERRIRIAISGEAKLRQAVAAAVTRAEQAQRGLVKSVKAAAKRGA